MELNISFASKAARAGERKVSRAIGGCPGFALAARRVTYTVTLLMGALE